MSSKRNLSKAQSENPHIICKVITKSSKSYQNSQSFEIFFNSDKFSPRSTKVLYTSYKNLKFKKNMA